jgi:hypothetical protein
MAVLVSRKRQLVMLWHFEGWLPLLFRYASCLSAVSAHAATAPAICTYAEQIRERQSNSPCLHLVHFADRPLSCHSMVRRQGLGRHVLLIAWGYHVSMGCRQHELEVSRFEHFVCYALTFGRSQYCCFVDDWFVPQTGARKLTSCLGNSPSRRNLATLTGLMEAAASVMKGIAPTLSNTVFALSVDKDWLHGRFYWVVMLGFCLALNLMTLLVKDSHAAWRVNSKPTATEDIMEDPVTKELTINPASRQELND